MFKKLTTTLINATFIFLVTFIFLLLVEGSASVLLSSLDSKLKVTNFKSPDPKLFYDPYLKKMVTKLPLGNMYLDNRYSPHNLAEFYYLNGSSEATEGLFTDSYGFIHNGDPYRNLQKELTGQRVFFLGGSSAAGGNSTSVNEHTISAFIEQFLNKKNSTENQVVNGGTSGYQSFRELILAQYMVGVFNTNTYIFFDGRNDWFYLTMWDRFYRNYEPESYERLLRASGEWQPPVEEFTESLQFKKLLKLLKRYYLGHGPLDPNSNVAYLKIGDNKVPRDGFTVQAKDFFRPNPNGATMRQRLDYRPESLENYIDNLESMAGFCIGRKKRCIIALQPPLGFGEHKMTQEESQYLAILPFENWLGSQNKFFSEASKRFVQLNNKYKDRGVEFIDLSNLFAKETRRVFLDSIHYLDYGNCILGSAFAAQLEFHDWKKFNLFKGRCDSIK